MVAGPDLIVGENLASAIAAQINAKAPQAGPTSPIHPPRPIVSLAQAALLTALVGAAFLGVRRVFAGRADRPVPLGSPPPIVMDVEAARWRCGDEAGDSRRLSSPRVR